MKIHPRVRQIAIRKLERSATHIIRGDLTPSEVVAILETHGPALKLQQSLLYIYEDIAMGKSNPRSISFHCSNRDFAEIFPPSVWYRETRNNHR